MKNNVFTLVLLMFSISAFSQGVTSLSQSSATVLANFQAQKKGNAVQVSWVALNEKEVANHQVQKSVNGSSFTNIGTLTAQNNNGTYGYTFLDATPTEGNNFYRLQSVDTKGNVTCSDILKVNDGFDRTDLRVLGNPVQAGVLNLQLTNISGGKYSIILYSNGGEKVFARSLNLTKGSLTQTINLPRSLGNGLYFLELNNGNMRINRQVMLQ